MADLADCEAAVVSVIAAAFYPSGPSSPSSLPGSINARVFRGWPNATALDADLKAGIVNVSVFSLPGFTREATRYPLDWITVIPAATTIAATVSGLTVTFSGAPGVPHLAGIRVSGRPYAYAASSSETPEAIAAALASLVPGASAAGAQVTVPGSGLTARVVGFATIGRELRRQKQGIKVTVFASSPDARDAASGITDAALAAPEAHFLPLPDGFCARLRYVGTFVDDVPTKEGLWKRDLRFTLEYPTTQIQSAPAVLWGVAHQAVAAASQAGIIA